MRRSARTMLHRGGGLSAPATNKIDASGTYIHTWTSPEALLPQKGHGPRTNAKQMARPLRKHPPKNLLPLPIQPASHNSRPLSSRPSFLLFFRHRRRGCRASLLPAMETVQGQSGWILGRGSRLRWTFLPRTITLCHATRSDLSCSRLIPVLYLLLWMGFPVKKWFDSTGHALQLGVLMLFVLLCDRGHAPGHRRWDTPS